MTWSMSAFPGNCCLTWVRPVCARGVIQNEYGGEIGADRRQVLGVGSKVQGAVLPIVPAQDGIGTNLQ